MRLKNDINIRVVSFDLAKDQVSHREDRTYTPRSLGSETDEDWYWRNSSAMMEHPMDRRHSCERQKKPADA